MTPDDKYRPPIPTNRYERARREGRLTAATGGDWQDNPYTPGMREYYAFLAGLEEGRRDDGR